MSKKQLVRRDKPLSLAPLKFEDALRGLLGTAPMPSKAKAKPAVKKRSAKKVAKRKNG